VAKCRLGLLASPLCVPLEAHNGRKSGFDLACRTHLHALRVTNAMQRRGALVVEQIYIDALAEQRANDTKQAEVSGSMQQRTAVYTPTKTT